MSVRPGIDPALDGPTSTRTKAETNRVLVGTIRRICRASGLHDLEPWQIRQLVRALRDQPAPSDEQVHAALMRAPWFPKRRRRHWRVGEGGGWATTS